MRLSFAIEGTQEISRKLLKLETSMQDFTIPFIQTGIELTGFFQTQVFDTQGAVIGEPWKRLSPVTIAQKARRGFSSPSVPLVGSGAMRRSFRYQASKSEVIIGNSQEYFKFHQSNQPRSRLPRRVMMKLDARRKSDIVRLFQKYIIDNAK